MQAIGYKEAAQALRGEMSREEAVALIQQNSRRYAKRQLTWFGRNPEARWIRWDKEPDLTQALEALRKKNSARTNLAGPSPIFSRLHSSFSLTTAVDPRSGVS